MNVVEVAANIATIKETVKELRVGSEGCNPTLEILRKFDEQLAELIEVQVFIAILEGNTAEFVADAFSLTVRQVNGIHTRRRIMATLRNN
jgi:hypothetical protein